GRLRARPSRPFLFKSSACAVLGCSAPVRGSDASKIAVLTRSERGRALRIARRSATMIASSQLPDMQRKVTTSREFGTADSPHGGSRMAPMGIRDLVGRAMIDKEFLAELLRDPHAALTDSHPP